MIKSIAINDVYVKPRWKKAQGNKPVRKEHAIISEKPYINVLIVGKKGYGKSTLALYLILDHFMNKDSKLVIFSPSILSDRDNINCLNEVMDKYGDDSVVVYKKIDNDDQGNSNLMKEIDESKDIFKLMNRSSNNKYTSPVSIFMFDDLSVQDLKRNTDLQQFAFNIRHSGSLCLFLSQDWVNFDKKIRQAADIVILFGSIPVERLKDIYTTVQPGIDFNSFEKMYHEATKGDKSNFLFIDVFTKQIRKNLNEELYIKDLN